MLKDDEALNEHISLAIAMWSLGLGKSVAPTHEQRQELHMAILKALEHVGAIEKS